MNQKRRDRMLTALFWIYIAWLLRITVFRPGFTLSALGQNGVISTTPFREYYYWLRQGRLLIAGYLFFGNIAVFLPFGGYAAWRRPRWRLWRVTLAGFTLSLTIEAGQYLLGTGVTDPADLVLNTLGALLGAALLRWGTAVWKKHVI